MSNPDKKTETIPNKATLRTLVRLRLTGSEVADVRKKGTQDELESEEKPCRAKNATTTETAPTPQATKTATASTASKTTRTSRLYLLLETLSLHEVKERISEQWLHQTAALRRR